MVSTTKDTTPPGSPGASSPAAQDPPPGRKFPCRNCGGQLAFDPAARALHCPYCGFLEKIDPAGQGVAEQDWEGYWRVHAGQEGSISGRSSQVACSACGAVVLLEDKVATDRCPYCGNALDNQPESAKDLIPPGGVLPFALTEAQARDVFNRWIAGRWFAPNSLRQFANLGRLAGAYVPFWTFDAMTFTHYTGARGDDYVETQTYTETGADGQPVTRTRQVTQTRWTPVSGEVRHFFENVLVHASRGVPGPAIDALAPWDLQKLEPFRPEFLTGFHAERYTLGLREGFTRAREIMAGFIRRLCEQDIGGDHQQLHVVQTQHVGVTFKHILLPVWLAAYRYRDRPYRIMVNGRTGRVAGERPYSWVKIAVCVLTVLAIALAVFLFARAARGDATVRPDDVRNGEAVAGSRAGSNALPQWATGRPRSPNRMVFAGLPDDTSRPPHRTRLARCRAYRPVKRTASRGRELTPWAPSTVRLMRPTPHGVRPRPLL